MRTLIRGYAAMVACLTSQLIAQTVTPNDPQFPAQWNLSRVGATNTWSITTGDTNVVVVVIDTGVDYTHSDLAANMWRNPGETGLDAQGQDKSTNGIDDDDNGYVDDVHGIDTYDHDGDPREFGYFDGTTTHFHGSDCAGIIGAAGNNGIGTVGINWRASIMAIRGFPLKADDFTEEEYVGSMIAAFDYVLEMKRRGVNIVVTSSSYYNASYSRELKDLIDAVGNEGILNVFAAGNNGMNNDEIGLYPCGYNSPSIISVGNSMRDDMLAPASCYGRSSVHLTAPGRDGIRSVYSSDFRGTSAACPHVAGAIALIKAAVPGATVPQVKAALLGGVDQPVALGNRVVSNGRLNVAKALTRLTNANAPAIVISAHPAGPRTRSDDVITVTFSRSMKTATVEAAFQLSPPSAGHFEWTNENQTFTFAPDVPLARRNYSVRILGFAENTEGGTLDGNFDSASQSSPADDFVWTFSFPVANDDFADAAEISSETGTVIGTTRNAYPETIEPNHADSLLSSPSVWYRWTAPASRWFTFDTLQSVTSLDTLLAVYTGTNMADLTAVAANDNYESSTRSRTTFAAVAGQTYKIAVAGKSIDENKADLRDSSLGSLGLAWYPTPSPVITSFTPTSGYPGQKITIHGANFTGATGVNFNGVSADFVPSTNGNFLDLQLVVTVPLNATTGPITIETRHGNVTTTNSFSLLVRPALTMRPLPDKTVELSWPAISGFALQRADSLASTSVWVGATILSSRVAEGIRYATLTNSVPNRFFRLHRP